jgi:hypothetical protein
VHIFDIDDGIIRMETKEQSHSHTSHNNHNHGGTGTGTPGTMIRLIHQAEEKKSIREWYHPNITGVYPNGRWAHSSVILQHQLFIFGGFNGSSCFDDVHVYDSGIHHCTLLHHCDV